MMYWYVRHDSFKRVPWRIHMCDMTQSYVCHDSFLCAPWRIHKCAMTHSYVCHDSFRCDSTLTCLAVEISPFVFVVCAMMRWYMRHDAFMYAPWRIHMCATTHSYVCHNSFQRDSTLTCVVRPPPFVCVMCAMMVWCMLYDTFLYASWNIRMCVTTQLYVCHDSIQCDSSLMGVPVQFSPFVCDMCAMMDWYMHCDALIYVLWCIHMTYSYTRHDAFMHTPWRIHTHAMTHSCTRHDAFIHTPWRIHTHAMTRSYTRHGKFIHTPWRINTHVMTHSYTRHDAFIHTPWRIDTHTMTHSYTHHDAFIHTPWCIDTHAMTHSYVCLLSPLIHLFAMTHSNVTRHSRVMQSNRPPFVYVIYTMMHQYMRYGAFLYAPWHIRMRATTHSYVCHDSFRCVSTLACVAVESPPLVCVMFAMMHSYVCHDALICVPWIIHLFAIIHSNVTRHSCVLQSNPHSLFVWGGYG